MQVITTNIYALDQSDLYYVFVIQNDSGFTSFTHFLKRLLLIIEKSEPVSAGPPLG